MRYLITGILWLPCTFVMANDAGKATTLTEALNFAERAASNIDQNIHDYTCILMRQERVDGRLHQWQFMRAKIRHEDRQAGVPFSVYLRFLKPSNVAGREVLYVKGDGLIARRGGTHLPNMTMHLAPTGRIAMDGNRYPITEAGFLTLTRRLIEVLERERARGNAQLLVFRNAKVDGRNCAHFRLTQRQKVPGSFFYMAEVYVDSQLGIPILYQAYDWPREKGGAPVLLEQYFYKDIRINVGLTNRDFDPKNPSYQFQINELLADK